MRFSALWGTSDVRIRTICTRIFLIVSYAHLARELRPGRSQDETRKEPAMDNLRSMHLDADVVKWIAVFVMAIAFVLAFAATLHPR